jgi:hypothetical protein
MRNEVREIQFRGQRALRTRDTSFRRQRTNNVGSEKPWASSPIEGQQRT